MMEAFVENLGDQKLLPRAHVDVMNKLKEEGFEPKVIYDVGACVLHWTNEIKNVWPNAEFVVFDAYASAEYLYKKNNFKYHIGVLSDKEKEVKWYENILMPGGNSIYRETFQNGVHFPEEKAVMRKTTTLDIIAREKNLPAPDLIKIDTQGSDFEILCGGEDILKNCKYAVMELQHTEYNKGAPLADYVIGEMKKRGWECIMPRFTETPVDGDYLFKKL